MKSRSLVPVLLTSTAITGLAGAAEAAKPVADQGLLDEVVVTATRRDETISKVPMSITAVTPEQIDQQGLKAIDDLSRVAPALTIRRGGDNQVTIAVRGIIASAGAQTTGVYLDDIPMQKRIIIGASTGNGNPSPALFDLERVEVLRGPQGTLYGGSSEGGTVRFLTPTPSLTTDSSYGRAETAITQGGGMSFEGGYALGGPIVEDKVGFRASAFFRRDGGWIDHRNFYTGVSNDKDTNWQDTIALRAATLWKVTDNFSVTPALYYSHNYINDADTFYESVPQFTIPAIKTGTYTYPAHTYGPVDLNTSTSLVPTFAYRTQVAFMPSVSLDYTSGPVNIKSVTAYLGDRSDGQTDSPFNEPGVLLGGTGVISEMPNFMQLFSYNNKRHGITQEIRFSSTNPDSRFSWVAGLFYNHSTTNAVYHIVEDLDTLTAIVLNQTVTQRYRTPMLPGQTAGIRAQIDTDDDRAVFGEGTLKVTDKLKFIAGIRATRTEFHFNGTYVGPLTGIGVATVDNGGLTDGGTKETPITPKGALQYQINSTDMVYATAAKGFRPGGVNTPVPLVSCAAGLAAYGGTPPSTYKSDSVWSYELGTKFRMLDNRLNVNISAFKIDWSDVQVSLGLPGCTFNFTSNAASAVSQGADIQATWKATDALSFSLAAGYDDAHYTDELRGPPSSTGSRTLLINKNDKLPVSPVTVSFSPQYEFTLFGDKSAYVRADYQYNGAYRRTYSVGASTYNPDNFPGNSTTLLNLRAGLKLKSADVALFVNNATNSTDKLSRAGGPSGCGTDPNCANPSTRNWLHTASTFRPMTVGLQVSVRR